MVHHQIGKHMVLLDVYRRADAMLNINIKNL